MAETNTPNALEVADKLDHLAHHLVSDRESVQQAAELIRAQHAALAASQPDAALADGWQDIATHDGRTEDVQLFCADTKEQFVGFPSGTAGAFQFAQYPGGIVSCRPTHWRPLPAPPTINASGEVRNG